MIIKWEREIQAFETVKYVIQRVFYHEKELYSLTKFYKVVDTGGWLPKKNIMIDFRSAEELMQILAEDFKQGE